MAKGKITQHSEENGSIDGIDKIPIIWRKLSDLTPNKDNPRTITKEDYNRLKNSMLRNPQMINAKPLLLSNRTGELVIIGGNQRFAVARAMGRTELPTVLFEGLTEEKEKEILIRDNVSDGAWDWDVLANGWADIDVLTACGVDVKTEPKKKERDVLNKFTLKLTAEEHEQMLHYIEDLSATMGTGSAEETILRVLKELCEE